MPGHALKIKPQGDRINIQEDYLGTATSQICYPRIQSCISLTVLTSHGLIGAHITVATEDSIINDIFSNMTAAKPTVAYVIGGIGHFKGKTKVSRLKTRKKMKSAIMKAMPNISNVYFFDTWQYSPDVNLGATKNGARIDFAWENGTPVNWNDTPDMNAYNPINANHLVQK